MCAMYHIEVTRLECLLPATLPDDRNSSSVRTYGSSDLYCDISCEGEIPRRFYLGSVRPHNSIDYAPSTIVHFAHRPVSFSLYSGAYTRISSHTISDFMSLSEDAGASEMRREVVFSSKRTPRLLYRLFLRIHIVRVEWSLSIAQVSRTHGTAFESLGLRVYFGKPSTLPSVGGAAQPGRVVSKSDNELSLGTYSASDVSSLYISHHGSLVGLGSAVLVWTAKRPWSQMRVLATHLLLVHYDQAENVYLTLDGEEPLVVLPLAGPMMDSWSSSIRFGEYVVELMFRFNRPVSPHAPLMLHGVGWQGSVQLPPMRTQLRVLIDGLQTFRAYFSAMRKARVSIDITAWELSLSFGLVRRKSPISENAGDLSPGSLWISLSDILLAKALRGVNVRILVWRHNMLSWAARWLYLGEVTIERECAKLQKRAEALGVPCFVYTAAEGDIPTDALTMGSFVEQRMGSITIIIDGNPHGLVSCHHEKMVLIDVPAPPVLFSTRGSQTSGTSEKDGPPVPEPPVAGVPMAFMGGFDMARGRFDQPAHQIPISYFSAQRGGLFNVYTHSAAPISVSAGGRTRKRYGDAAIQPFFRPMRLLWHDVQLAVRGAEFLKGLKMHFEQRWYFACTRDVYKTRHFEQAQKAVATIEPSDEQRKSTNLSVLAQIHLPHAGQHRMTPDEIADFLADVDIPDSMVEELDEENEDPAMLPWFEPAQLELSRGWPPVIDSRALIDSFARIISSAKRLLYVEHQYPFHNETLTHMICARLATNPDLHVVVVTPVVSDLPRGVLGSMIDMSQDDVHGNLSLIYSSAPDRVGVYGVVSTAFEHVVHRLEPQYRIKPIYVHSKVVIADDSMVLIGSANMDNMSLFRASELAVLATDTALALHLRMRLWREHLTPWDVPADLVEGSRLFKKMAAQNLQRLQSHKAKNSQSHDLPLVGRVVPLVPGDVYRTVRDAMSPSAPVQRMANKLGIWPPSSETLDAIARGAGTTESGFFLQSML